MAFFRRSPVLQAHECGTRSAGLGPDRRFFGLRNPFRGGFGAPEVRGVPICGVAAQGRPSAVADSAEHRGVGGAGGVSSPPVPRRLTTCVC